MTTSTKSSTKVNYVGTSKFTIVDAQRITRYICHRTKLDCRYKVGRIHLTCTPHEYEMMLTALDKELKLHAVSFKRDKP